MIFEVVCNGAIQDFVHHPYLASMGLAWKFCAPGDDPRETNQSFDAATSPSDTQLQNQATGLLVLWDVAKIA